MGLLCVFGFLGFFSVMLLFTMDAYEMPLKVGFLTGAFGSRFPWTVPSDRTAVRMPARTSFSSGLKGQFSSSEFMWSHKEATFTSSVLRVSSLSASISMWNFSGDGSSIGWDSMWSFSRGLFVEIDLCLDVDLDCPRRTVKRDAEW